MSCFSRLPVNCLRIKQGGGGHLVIPYRSVNNKSLLEVWLQTVEKSEDIGK